MKQAKKSIETKRYYSCKISKKNLSNLITNKNISSKSIDIFLWLLRRQDASGLVSMVKYSDICNDIGISFQTYYNCIEILEKQGFISVIEKNNHIGADILIIDNVFLSSSDDKKGYFEINFDFFFSNIFIDLRANEKKIILYILSNYRIKDYIKFTLHINSIIENLGIKDNIQLIRSYINNISKMFEILNIEDIMKRKEKKKPIKPLKIIDIPIIKFMKTSVSEKYNYCKHLFKGWINKYKVKYTKEEFEELIKLINMYSSDKYIDGFGSLLTVIENTLKEKKKILPNLITKIASEFNIQTT